MLNKLYRILLILGIVAVLVAIPAFWLTFQAANDLEVNFLDVGQGDSIFIKTPYGQSILIDGGPDNTVIKRLGENLSWWDKRIDLMILTHPHDDHIFGLIDVIKRYKVEKILYTGVVHTSPNYLIWLELVRDRHIPLTIIDRAQTIKLGEDCNLEIIYPRSNLGGQTAGNLNNSSIVAKLIYGESKFLFTGDAEVEIEKELIEADIDLRADVLKVSHHGSDTSSSKEFLEKVKPKFAVIQVGANNDFGHPSTRIIKRLERINAQILRTDLEGTVKLVSDGEEIEIR
jgi:competence protein ComEC